MGKTQQILTRWNVQSDDVDTLGSQGLRVDSWLWPQPLLRPSEGDGGGGVRQHYRLTICLWHFDILTNSI